jgi:hypothetical protein
MRKTASDSAHPQTWQLIIARSFLPNCGVNDSLGFSTKPLGEKASAGRSFSDGSHEFPGRITGSYRKVNSFRLM